MLMVYLLMQTKVSYSLPHYKQVLAFDLKQPFHHNIIQQCMGHDTAQFCVSMSVCLSICLFLVILCFVTLYLLIFSTYLGNQLRNVFAFWQPVTVLHCFIVIQFILYFAQLANKLTVL